MKCPSCGRSVVNKKMNLGYAEWCPSALACTGLDTKKEDKNG